ncbi:hypothetical protein GGI43DRAFT_431328 [Trichoderma evansii]
MPHIIPSIWEYCAENASTLAKAPGHVSAWLLALALKGKTYINLALFPDLAPTAARDVLRSTPEARAINLSGTAAMAAYEVEETLAAIDHDLDALYLLTPPGDDVGLPKEVMRALKNWNHRCSKVLISSVLAGGPRWEVPRSLPPRDVLYPVIRNNKNYVPSRSFPITQMIYQSTFDTEEVSPGRPIMAHIFLGGGLVAPFRLWKSILMTIKDMHFNHGWGNLGFAKFLVHHLALGPQARNSDDYLEVRSIPMDASFAVYRRIPLDALYTNPGYHLSDLTPDAWTVVVLRDGIREEPILQTGEIHNNRFRIVLLRPKHAIPAGERQSISATQFDIMVPPLSPNRQSSAAEYVLEHDDNQSRTVIQLQVGPYDMIDAITVMQKVLDAAATVREDRKKLNLPTN